MINKRQTWSFYSETSDEGDHGFHEHEILNVIKPQQTKIWRKLKSGLNSGLYTKIGCSVLDEDGLFQDGLEKLNKFRKKPVTS